MKILLVTSVYKNEVVGPARFARLLESSSLMDVDVLTSNVVATESLKSVNINFSWWQKKLKNYFSIKHFTNSILKLKDNYDVIIYNSSILVDPQRLKFPFIVMVNDEKLASLKFKLNFDYLRRILYRSIEKNAVKSASKVIVNSKYLKSKIASAYSIDSNKIYVLHKGIALANKRSDFKDNLSLAKPIKILFLKNDFYLGGLPDLISALGLMKENTFSLTIIGTNSKVNECLIHHPNLSYNVLGFQANDKVVQAMYNHDILCIPSRFEPLGVAVMEGLAVGIPTITTGVGGLPEVTNNGEFVWECEPNNPQSIATQIEACISNSELRNKKSLGGKAYVHEKFNFDIVVDRLKHIIAESQPIS